MNGLYEFYAALNDATSRTVNSVLETLLDNEINIPKGIRSQASTSHKHLRDFLSNEKDRDDSFPRVLLIEDNDFLGGSFARHTKTWPLDDIDIYFPLDGNSLIYSEWGTVQPYTVVTDGYLSENPLLYPRWMNGQSISSEKLISEFAKVLNRHYPKQTKIKPNGQAVTIRMTYGETESGDGLGFDIVPCFSMRPYSSSDYPFYLMSNGNDGWIRTNPRIDTELSQKLHADNNKTYRKVVKLLKYWNKKKLNGRINSYYIELATAKIYLEKNNNNEFVNRTSFGVTLGFWAVENALRKGNQESFIPRAPAVVPGNLQALDNVSISICSSKANEAWESEKAGKEREAITKWKEVFDADFLDAA